MQSQVKISLFCCTQGNLSIYNSFMKCRAALLKMEMYKEDSLHSKQKADQKKNFGFLINFSSLFQILSVF